MLKYKIPQIVTLTPKKLLTQNKISDLDKEHKKSFINQ